jgi:transcriptional regulator with XRE-family HTH domain
MTSISKKDLEDYGLARVRDIAFDAVQSLWRLRQKSGVTQKDLANLLDRDPSWISRQLSGPGNWTFRSFGALVEALDGEVEIIVHPIEDPLPDSNNYDAYTDIPEKHNTRDHNRNITVKHNFDKSLNNKFSHHRYDLHLLNEDSQKKTVRELEVISHG